MVEIAFMGFVCFCVLSIVTVTIKSFGESQKQPIESQLHLPKIDVRLDAPKMPSADDIADSLMRKYQQEQLLGKQPQWHIEQGQQNYLPQHVQPRLGNAKKEIVRL